MRRIGAWCFDHRIAAVGVWLLALAAVFGAAGAIGPAYDSVLDIPDSDSADGFAALDERFPELGIGSQSGTIVF
jgi:putative drug exporter of the RND superfamily